MVSKIDDVVVIGGGPGGYAAAFLAADAGFSTTLIDLDTTPGGVCLHRGCIPSKALLHVAKLIRETNEASQMGLSFSEPDLDLDRLRAWKNEVVKRLTGGLGQQCKTRGVNFIQGRARFLGSNRLSIESTDGSLSEMPFAKAVLATGSRPFMLPHLESDSPWVMDSTAALDLEDIPESMLVIGGGIIGLELGSAYAALGSRITIVEATSGLIPGADRDLVRIVEKTIKGQVEKILLNTSVTALNSNEKGVEAVWKDGDGQETSQFFSRILMAVGRRPNTEDIGLENTQVVVEEGVVRVDLQMRTDDPNIFAIGDIVKGPMLAHKAAHEARVAVDALAGKKSCFEPKAIPGVCYTDPELAWVGLTETAAKAKNITVKIARFPWAACGRAHTVERFEGVTKLIVDPQTNRILGMGIVGAGAGELLAEGGLAIEMGATVQDLADTIHAHPTLSETVMEAAEVSLGHCTHFYVPKRGK
ncbi:MAG: dihydrolipoyl dehydrogenase [Magnetococcales bacterium]|nr:dihydrolipoyl dehydrogenase [Magnetococcales bacterium]